MFQNWGRIQSEGLYLCAVVLMSMVAHAERLVPEQYDKDFSTFVYFQDTYLYPAGDGLQRITVPSLTSEVLTQFRAMDLVVIGDKAFFAGSSRQELWITDGTSQGTVKLADAPEGHQFYLPPAAFGSNNSLIFLARTYEGYTSLWKSDTTAEGTQFVEDLGQTSDVLYYNMYYLLDGRLYLGYLDFVDTEPEFTYYGYDLWAADGTLGGTLNLLHSEDATGASLSFHQGTQVLTLSTSGVSSVWRTDGSAEGTVNVTEHLDPSPPSSSDQFNFIDRQGHLFINAVECVESVCSNRQVWRWDGTEFGTYPLEVAGVDWNTSSVIAMLDQDTALIQTVDLPNNRDLYRFINLTTGDAIDVLGPRAASHMEPSYTSPSFVRDNSVYFWFTGELTSPRGNAFETTTYHGFVKANASYDSAELVQCRDNLLYGVAFQPLYKLLDANGGVFVTAPLRYFLRETDELCFGEESGQHSSDTDGNGIISFSELLRVIQFYNIGGYRCAPEGEITEDGFTPGRSGISCRFHDTDFIMQNAQIELSELLRLVQFYNAGGYTYCPKEYTEDGFCPNT